jgi:NAD-dependent deacetylase
MLADRRIVMHRHETVDAATCAAWIRERGPVVALTGAGVSTAAGIPDFRGPQGLYVTRRYDPDKVFDLAAFLDDPLPFFDFSRDFLSVLDTVVPTVTHRALAALERCGLLAAVVTQNIDALHQRAGSGRVLEVHGSYWTSTCLGCGRSVPLDRMRELILTTDVPRCACGGVVKPDVVFFGEPVRALDEASAAIRRAGLLLVLGSSLTVYPAAWLPEACPGAVVAVNQGPVGLSPGRDRYVVDADLDEFFTAVAEELALEAS